MIPIVILVFVYFLCVNGSGIFHEQSKITFYPDNFSHSVYFGYSVLSYKNSLIVGAPKATNREKPTDSGVVFNCTLNELERSNVTCYPLEILEQDHYNMRLRRFQQDVFFKSDMWFGATIGAIANEQLLICAPRYTERFSEKHLLANGVCYVRRPKRDYIIYPLKDKSHQAFRTDGSRKEYGDYGSHLNYYAYGEAGMSMKVTGGNNVIIGAPGLLQWAGGIVSLFFLDNQRGYRSTEYRIQATSNPYYTKELTPDDYFGYSVESGLFQENGSILYVGGAPRSKSGYGQVLVFEPATYEMESLKVRAKLRGPQLGSYFGASLCCMDIDGDGADDLLVGAPNYVVKNGGLPYDQGAVFVYVTKQMDKTFNLEPSGFVCGSGESGARFGTTIADLGDLDGDGFKDVAVGAPWENDGSGVVYIYRGYNKGLRSMYHQRILAKGSGSLGISLSTGFDVDGNNCNDLAIGAAKSATVYLYRCIPTVLVHTAIKVPDAMNLPHNATGFTALFCVTLPEKPQWPHVKINFKAKITIDPEGSRATISGDSEYTITAMPGNERCDEQSVDVNPTADLSKPIFMKFELEPDEKLSNSLTFDRNAVRVSEESDLESTFLIQLVRDCGEDMICTPWLVMTLDALDKPFVPGTATKLGARLSILNEEEPAYGARVNISLPMIPKRLPSPCSLEDLIMTCDVPAPLLRDQEIVWDIELEYNLNSSSEVNLKVVAELEDSLYYRNISSDSVIELVLEVTPEASFNVTGIPLPNDTIIITREKFYNADHIVFTNYIQITNLGPSDWYHLEVHFLFDIVYLASPIDNCEDFKSTVVCVWSVQAKHTIPFLLPLRFDLSKYGEVLEGESTVNTTTSVILYWQNHEPAEEFYANTTITTNFVLEAAPPLWLLISCIVAGVVFGLLLLGLIVYIFHKNGFFSRRQHQRLKELQDQGADEEPPEDLEESAAPSVATANASEFNESTRELLFEDSD